MGRVLHAAARNVIIFPSSPNSKGKTRRKLKQCHPSGLSSPEMLVGTCHPRQNSAAFLADMEIRCVALWLSDSESDDRHPGISGQQIAHQIPRGSRFRKADRYSTDLPMNEADERAY